MSALTRYDVFLVSFPVGDKDAITGLGEAFGITAAEAQDVVSSAPVVVKRAVERHVGVTYLEALQRLGADARLKPIEADAPSMSLMPPAPMTSVPPLGSLPPRQNSLIPRSLAPARIVNLDSQSSNPPDSSVDPSPSIRATSIRPTSLRPALIGSTPPSGSGAPGAGTDPFKDVPVTTQLLRSKAVWGLVLLTTCVGLYFAFRTPRRAGLVVHEMGSEQIGAPTVILLHGFGADGDDLVPLGEELLRNGLGSDVRVLVPEGLDGILFGGRAWWESEEGQPAAKRAVLALVADLVGEGVDPQQVLLVGFSQGGILAIDVASALPSPPGGVAVLSGKSPSTEFATAATSLEGVDVLVAHGSSDRIMSFGYAERLRDELTGAGARVEFVEFAGGHSIPPSVRLALASFCRARF